MQHHFDIEIATKYDVDTAIFLNNLAFWLHKNVANEKHLKDGRYWTYNSLKAFSIIFPYWSSRQMERIIKNCLDNDLILKQNPNGHDRTTWYSLTDHCARLLNISISPNGELENTERGIGNTHSVKSSITDNKTDNKTDKGIEIPDFVDKEVFEQFKEHRKNMKRKMTDQAIVLLMSKLTKFHQKGYNVNEILKESIMNGWQSVFEPRQQFTSTPQSNFKQTAPTGYRGIDYTQRRLDQEVDERNRKSQGVNNDEPRSGSGRGNLQDDQKNQIPQRTVGRSEKPNRSRFDGVKAASAYLLPQRGQHSPIDEDENVGNG